MNNAEKQYSLIVAKTFFNKIADSYEKKLKNISYNDFNINPFTVDYLSHVAFGCCDPKSIARSLVYPRIFGTSLATSFGTQMQKFCSEAGFAKPSGISGMDIEFEDKTTGKWLICQLKSGPQTINSKDVDPMCKEFKAARNLFKTNGSTDIHDDNFVVGVLYGTKEQLSTNYKRIMADGWDVYIGQEFWYRLTGDMEYYRDLIALFSQLALAHDCSDIIDNLVDRVASKIKECK